MLEKRIYAIFDKVAEQMIGPMVVLPNDPAARRMFQDALLGEGSNLATHPADYSLFFLGTVNTDTGAITPAPTEKPFGGVPLVTGETIADLAARRMENVTHEG